MVRSSRRPLVSVVIPVRGRRRQLQTLLWSLVRQDRRFDVEVIVIDNPRPTNRAWLQAATWPFRLRHEHLTIGNRGLARNVGAAVADGDWLLFADSDVMLTPPAIAGLLASVQAQSSRIVMADVRFPPATPRSLASHLFDVAAYFPRYRRQAKVSPLTWQEFVSCAFLVDREVFAATGGFDEGFAHYGYEDVEFALRAEHAGCTFGLAPATVHHYKPLTPARVLAQAVEAGRSAVRLVALHADIERRLRVGVADWRSGALHYDEDFDVAGLLSAVRKVERRWSHRQRTCQPRALPALRDTGRALYAELRRYGRFQGITTELTEAT